MYEVCEDNYLDGVRYLEVRFSPILHTQQGLSLSQIMEAVCDGQVLAEHSLPMTVRIIVCGMRQLAPEVSKSLAMIAWRYRNRGVIAFDLAGPEDGFSSKNHREAFDIVRTNLLNCTLHSGEAAGWRSIQDSIRYCGAHRIGHGVRLAENEELLQYVIDKRIPLETCVTSNIQTKAVASAATHPVREYFKKGVIIVPCTDNRTVSNVTLTSEYYRLHTEYEFSLEELVLLIDYGFRAAFVDKALKIRLRGEALRRIVAVLNSTGHSVAGIIKQHVEHFASAHVRLDEGVEEAPKSHNSISSPKLGPVSHHPMRFSHSVFHGLGVISGEGPSPSRKTPSSKDVSSSKLSLRVLKRLPKADCHCRLGGSVPLNDVWDALVAMDSVHIENFGTRQAFVREAMQWLKNTEKRALLNDIILSTLQTESALIAGVKAVIRDALEENVLYLELMVRPFDHTAEQLSPQTVLETICHAVKEETADKDIDVSLVVYVRMPEDDPIAVHQAAQLAIRCRRCGCGVQGFGVFGDDLSEKEYQFFRATFALLKDENFNVVCAAGRKDTETIIPAIHLGGASRISGAFQMHDDPDVMNYLVNHRIGVEINNTWHLKQSASSISSSLGNPLRLFSDRGIKAVLSSFSLSFSGKTRTEMLHDVIIECNFTPAETLTLLGNGFRNNFATHKQRNVMYRNFWTQATKHLQKHGIEADLVPWQYFPPTPSLALSLDDVEEQ
jgi:adenosine deaminase